MREPSSEASSRGLVTRSRGLLRWFSPGRPWYRPMPWKDFYFVAGGIGGVFVRFGAYALLWYVAVAMTSGIFGTGFVNTAKQTNAIFLFLAMVAVTFDAGLVISRSLHEEVRSQTLATLMLLPVSSGRILYGKVLGSLLGWLPGPLCLLFGMTYHQYGRESVEEFFRHPGPPAWLIAHLLLVPHAAAVSAMFVRWGALPLGISLAIGSLFLSGSVFSALRVNDNSVIVWTVAFGVLLICGLCHLVVWLKAEALCAR